MPRSFARKRAGDSVSGYTAGFERFWTNYPKYKRKGKGAAFKSWVKHNLEDKAGAIVEVLQAQVEHDEHFGKFTPLPTTYLNQGRYDDDVPKPKRVMPQANMPVEGPREECKFVASIKRVAFVWLFRRRGLPDDQMEKFTQMVRALADDARELYDRGELTDAYAKHVRAELSAMFPR